jgi:pyruvate/2-oxoglutarate dehydrogenase complex dihydrolipoamide dehydrogenase (E3) component
MRSFDAIIVGAGQAGPPLAGRLTAAGMSVALIERHLIGGTCVNTGCRPTKTLVASAYAAHLARRSAEYGITTGEVSVDMRAVAARAGKVVIEGRTGNEQWLEGMEGLTLLRGHARFTGPKTMTVNGEAITAPRLFLNVGGRATVPDMPGVGEVPHLDNSSIIALDRVPRHLVVVGGSYVGLEFATDRARGPRCVGCNCTYSERRGHRRSYRRRLYRLRAARRRGRSLCLLPLR